MFHFLDFLDGWIHAITFKYQIGASSTTPYHFPHTSKGHPYPHTKRYPSISQSPFVLSNTHFIWYKKIASLPTSICLHHHQSIMWFSSFFFTRSSLLAINILMYTETPNTVGNFYRCILARDQPKLTTDSGRIGAMLKSTFLHQVLFSTPFENVYVFIKLLWLQHIFTHSQLPSMMSSPSQSRRGCCLCKVVRSCYS